MYINKTIAEVSNFFNDGNWIESKDQSINGIRLIQTGNIGKGFFKNKEKNKRYISTDTFTRLKCSEIFEGDILVSRLPDPIGRSCKIPTSTERMITAVDCSIIRLKNSVNPDFFLFFSQSNQYFKQIEDNITGTTRSRISRSNLGKIVIPVPSLSEQQAIVEKLDFAFDAIEKAKANIERNIENAKELFQSRLNKIINLNENDKKLLGDISQIRTGKLNSNAMIEGGIYNFFTCSREIFKINNYAFDCEAVLLAGNNASGDFNVKHFEGKFNAYQRTYVITSNPKILNLKLLKYILEGYLANFKRMSIGANTKFLKIDMIKNVGISLPNIMEQEKIVDHLDKLSLHTKLLVEKYKHKLANLEELKKSILEKAFKGELV